MNTKVIGLDGNARECPVPECTTTTSQVFCDAHWNALPGDVRRLINRALKVDLGQGRKQASPETKMAIKIAWEELKRQALAARVSP